MPLEEVSANAEPVPKHPNSGLNHVFNLPDTAHYPHRLEWQPTSCNSSDSCRKLHWRIWGPSLQVKEMMPSTDGSLDLSIISLPWWNRQLDSSHPSTPSPSKTAAPVFWLEWSSSLRREELQCTLGSLSQNFPLRFHHLISQQTRSPPTLMPRTSIPVSTPQ